MAALGALALAGGAALLLRTVGTAESDDSDLSVTVSEVATGEVGRELTYELTVVNRGPADATEVTVVDPVPSGVGFRAARSHPSCKLTGPNVTCRPGKVAKGSSVKMPITLVALRPGGITHTVTVSGAEPDPRTANNAATAKTSVRG